MKLPMSLIKRYLILSAMFLVGCRTAHNVAVTSFRVIDAPANYVRHHIDDESAASSTTTYHSDVTTPGQPIVTATPPRTTPTRRTVVDNGAGVEGTTEPKPHTASQSATANSQSPKIPYAKPVPGKPGYVYSPFDPNGGYVDVTGYASGSKAKDPYSGKIFIVP
jgi:hypothetical protein